MRDFDEYEFILADGSSRYEMIDLSQPVGAQMFAFKRLHSAVAAWPLRRAAESRYRERLVKKRHKSALCS